MSDALKEFKEAWRRVIYDATGDNEKALRAIELAELNGLFDPVKAWIAQDAYKTEAAENLRKLSAGGAN